MLDKVKSFYTKHHNEIEVAAIFVGVFAGGILIGYTAGMMDTIKNTYQDLPNQLKTVLFEQNGKTFLQVNGKLFEKI